MAQKLCELRKKGGGASGSFDSSKNEYYQLSWPSSGITINTTNSNPVGVLASLGTGTNVNWLKSLNETKAYKQVGTTVTEINVSYTANSITIGSIDTQNRTANITVIFE